MQCSCGNGFKKWLSFNLKLVYTDFDCTFVIVCCALTQNFNKNLTLVVNLRIPIGRHYSL